MPNDAHVSQGSLCFPPGAAFSLLVSIASEVMCSVDPGKLAAGRISDKVQSEMTNAPANEATLKPNFSFRSQAL